MELTYNDAIELFLNGNAIQLGKCIGWYNKPKRRDAVSAMKRLIMHNFLNWDYFLGSCEYKEAYLKLFKKVILPYIKDNFSTYHTLALGKHLKKDLIHLKNEYNDYYEKRFSMISNFILNSDDTLLIDDYMKFLKKRELEVYLESF